MLLMNESAFIRAFRPYRARAWASRLSWIQGVGASAGSPERVADSMRRSVISGSERNAHVKREACKFFSGAFAALAYVHAAYAVAASRGIINEPVFLGRKWGVGYMWAEAALYSTASLAFGYAGWVATSQEQPNSTLYASNGQSSQPARAAEQLQPTSG
jgi:hypothetical protein